MSEEKDKKRVVRSMRGEMVDFDLFDLKKQMANAPITEDIKERERFIDMRRKRGTRRKIQEMLAQQVTSEQMVRKAMEKQKAEAALEEGKPAEEVQIEVQELESGETKQRRTIKRK